MFANMASPQLENGYTKIANEIIDQFCNSKNRFSGEEWVILWIILRKTYGFHKKEDKIALTQFYQLSGMKKPSIIRALHKLEQKRVVSKKANDIATLWLFNKDYNQWKPLAKKLINILLAKKLMTVSKKANKSLAKKLPTKDSTKDTLTKDIIPKGIKQAQTYGNPDINKIIDYLQEKQNLKQLDGSVKWNRIYAKNLLKKFGGVVDKVLRFMDFALKDPFHQKNTSSIKYLYNNVNKIALAYKTKIERNPRYVQ